MKRLLLLFLSALGILLAIPEAQAKSTACGALAGVSPVSAYASQVLARADGALAYAHSRPSSSDIDLLFPSWARIIASAALSLSDVRTSVTDAGRDLTENSACLHLDLTLIDCKIEETRDALNDGYAKGSFSQLFRLQSLMQFLADRRHALQAGATTPFYEDGGFGKTGSFDPPGEGYCCAQAAVPGQLHNRCEKTTSAACGDNPFFQTADACGDFGCDPPLGTPEAHLCPFSTDYLPPQQNGYGCDAAVLSAHLAGSPIKDEYEALTGLTAKIESLRALTQTGSAQSGTGAAATGTGGMQDHRMRQGCGVVAESGASLPAVTELRGPFSFGIDWRRILSNFGLLRAAQGEAREQSDPLKLPSEQSAASGGTVRRASPFSQAVTGMSRVFFRLWNKVQGTQEAAIAPVADGGITSDDTLAPLRASIAHLSRLAADPAGMRQLAVNYAYWLRRTCTDRPCNQRLETILKIALSPDDACFPYVSGAFLSDSCDNPGDVSRAQKCAEAAGIEVPKGFFPACGQ